MFKIAVFSRQPFLILGLSRAISEWQEFSLICELSDEMILQNTLCELSSCIDLFVIEESMVAIAERVLELIAADFWSAKLCLLSDTIPTDRAMKLGANARLPFACPLAVLRSTLNSLLSGGTNGGVVEQEVSIKTVGDSRDRLLSCREIQILKLVATGLKNHQIAVKLCISLATVKAHMHNILRKMDVPDRTSAAVIAYRNGWL